MAIEERIGKLEKMNRRLLIITCLMGTILLLVVSLGANVVHDNKVFRSDFIKGQTNIQDTIRTRNLELVGKDGKNRAVLTVYGPEDEPGFALLDKDGKIHAIFAIEDEPYLILYDKNMKNRASLMLVNDNAGLKLSGKDGNPLAILGVSEDEPNLEFYDKDMKARITLNVKNDEPSLAMNGEGATLRTILTIFKNDPHLWMLGKNGKLIFEAP